MDKIRSGLYVQDIYYLYCIFVLCTRIHWKYQVISNEKLYIFVHLASNIATNANPLTFSKIKFRNLCQLEFAMEQNICQWSESLMSFCLYSNKLFAQLRTHLKTLQINKLVSQSIIFCAYKFRIGNVIGRWEQIDNSGDFN